MGSCDVCKRAERGCWCAEFRSRSCAVCLFAGGNRAIRLGRTVKQRIRNIRVEGLEPGGEMYVTVRSRRRYVNGPLAAKLRALNVRTIELLDRAPRYMAYHSGAPWLQVVGTRQGVVLLYEQPSWCTGGSVLVERFDMCEQWQRLLGVPQGKTRWARMRFHK
jgi:hypothetical protein